MLMMMRRSPGLFLLLGISFNTLCEQYPQQSLQHNASCFGCEEKWVDVGGEKYKFLNTSDGTTRDEAAKICEENGGHLAEIRNEEERQALQIYYKKNIQTKNLKIGWWIGATDEEKEAFWRQCNIYHESTVQIVMEIISSYFNWSMIGK